MLRSQGLEQALSMGGWGEREVKLLADRAKWEQSLLGGLVMEAQQPRGTADAARGPAESHDDRGRWRNRSAQSGRVLRRCRDAPGRDGRSGAGHGAAHGR